MEDQAPEAQTTAADPAQQSRPTSQEVGIEIFKNLIDRVGPKTKEDVVYLVNAALYTVCCIQNNFYTVEDRPKFADALAETLKSNIWLPKEEPKTEGLEKVKEDDGAHVIQPDFAPSPEATV